MGTRKTPLSPVCKYQQNASYKKQVSATLHWIIQGGLLQNCTGHKRDKSVKCGKCFCFSCSERLVVPRVLSCLHIFCEQCLDRKLIDEGGDAGPTDMLIMCPTCSQNTKVGICLESQCMLYCLNANMIRHIQTM